MIFRTFDESGHLLLEDIIPIEEKRSLQTPITSTLEREELLVLGTWGDRQMKQATGFFSIKIDPFAEQKINYFDLASLRHYLDYTKPKRAERIRKNSEEDLKAGRNPDFANYIMPYRIQEHQDGFLMLAEVYSPLSGSNQYNGYNGPYNNMGYASPYYNPFYSGYYFPNRMYRPFPYSTGNNVKSADEVKTIQNVLLAFNGEGNLIWDYGMKINDLSRPALEQVTDFYYADKKLYLVCKIEDAELQVKTISTDREEMEEIKTKIMLRSPQDEFRSERELEGGVRQWYDNSFYVWGYQTIRNDSEENRVRDVFYINKVVVK